MLGNELEAARAWNSRQGGYSRERLQQLYGQDLSRMPKPRAPKLRKKFTVAGPPEQFVEPALSTPDSYTIQVEQRPDGSSSIQLVPDKPADESDDTDAQAGRTHGQVEASGATDAEDAKEIIVPETPTTTPSQNVTVTESTIAETPCTPTTSFDTVSSVASPLLASSTERRKFKAPRGRPKKYGREVQFGVTRRSPRNPFTVREQEEMKERARRCEAAAGLMKLSPGEKNSEEDIGGSQVSLFFPDDSPTKEVFEKEGMDLSQAVKAVLEMEIPENEPLTTAQQSVLDSAMRETEIVEAEVHASPVDLSLPKTVPVEEPAAAVPVDTGEVSPKATLTTLTADLDSTTEDATDIPASETGLEPVTPKRGRRRISDPMKQPVPLYSSFPGQKVRHLRGVAAEDFVYISTASGEQPGRIISIDATEDSMEIHLIDWPKSLNKKAHYLEQSAPFKMAWSVVVSKLNRPVRVEYPEGTTLDRLKKQYLFPQLADILRIKLRQEIKAKQTKEKTRKGKGNRK